MENKVKDQNSPHRLVQIFGSGDPGARIAARDQLVALGDRAVDEIVKAFESDRRQVRWEAANCLRMIGSEKAIPALIRQIEDAESDVGWLAAEALISIGERSLLPLLDSLTTKEHQDLGHLYDHSHHVIRTFAASEKYQQVLQPLLNAFDSSEPQMGVPVKAYEARQALGG